jgi:chemotaxis protein histidine kinase CheA
MLAQTVGTQFRPRPLSLSGAELERVLERQMQVREETDPSRQLQSTEQVMAREERLTESLFFKDYLLPEELKDRQQLAREQTETEQPEADLKPEERVRDEFIEELEEQLRQEGSERIAELLRERPELSDSQAQEAQQPPVTGGQQPGAAIDSEQDESILTEEQQAEAAALLSQYKTFERLAAARAAQYLTAAERFLKEGKFYKASDAFALAAVWTPRDARPYAGQAFALFAAGEYVSSSYHLRRAIVRNPIVASEKVDLAQLIGDRDVFENRLVEMTQWQQRSESGELAFMMAFVLHQDGKPQRAAEAIGQALEKMPDDQAVQILHRVITDGQASQD